MKNNRITNRILRFFVQHFLGGLLSDESYLKLLFRLNIGQKLDLENPRTFNEKLQWLKLYGYKPIYTTMADKFAVKEFVSKKIGNEYVVPCLGIWDNASMIDFEKLPNQFVLKCTHNSGEGRCICKDKSLINQQSVRAGLDEGLKKDYYRPARETPYRDIPHKIIADKYLDDKTGKELRDYKFWCFNGIPMYMYYTNKGEKVFENFYDMDFNPVYINHGFPRLLPEIEKPMEFELMKDLASKLSEGIPFVRVDFFDVDHHVFFAEYTFYDWGGSQPFEGDWDEKLGELIKLPITK